MLLLNSAFYYNYKILDCNFDINLCGSYTNEISLWYC
jgi:hypothetical protein